MKVDSCIIKSCRKSSNVRIFYLMKIGLKSAEHCIESLFSFHPALPNLSYKHGVLYFVINKK
jgi:hypothetical protein